MQQKVKYGVLGDISKESEKDIVKSMSSKADLSSKEDKVECTENIDLNSVKVGRAYNNGKIMFTVLEIHEESTVEQFMKRHKTELSYPTLSGVFTFFKTIMKHNAVWLLKNIQSTTKSYLVRRAQDGTLDFALGQFDYQAAVDAYEAAADGDDNEEDDNEDDNEDREEEEEDEEQEEDEEEEVLGLGIDDKITVRSGLHIGKHGKILRITSKNFSIELEGGTKTSLNQNAVARRD